MTLAHPSHDPTHYPEHDDMSENTLETLCRILLIPLLRRYLAARGTPMFVSGNQFVYWVQGAPTQSLSPDIYVVPGLPPDAVPGSIKTWELGEEGVPTFAIEIVSTDKPKDYERAPVRYDDLGTKELIIYDPNFVQRRDGKRFQVYRRLPKHGLRLIEATNDDRIESRVLGCFLREVTEDGSPRLRLGVGKHGNELVPTEAEAERAAKEDALRQAEIERAATEAERLAKEAAQQQAEAERLAKEAAEERVRKLEALLAEQARKAEGLQCFRDTHNAELAKCFPIEAVCNAQKSLAKAVEDFLACADLVDTLARAANAGGRNAWQGVRR